MFKQILISILAFLLSIFPHNANLLGAYQEAIYSGRNTISEQIVSAINDNDIEKLKMMMSPYMKEKNSDLDDKLQILLNAIDDNIINYRVVSSGETSKSNYGYYIKGESWKILFNYRERQYGIVVSYMIAYTNNLDYVGINTFRLMCDDTVYPGRLFNDIVSIYSIDDVR